MLQTLFSSVPRKNKDVGRTLILGAMTHPGSDEWVCPLPMSSWLRVDYWVEVKPLYCLSPGKGSQSREMRAWGGYTLASVSPTFSTSQSHGLNGLNGWATGGWRKRTWKLKATCLNSASSCALLLFKFETSTIATIKIKLTWRLD